MKAVIQRVSEASVQIEGTLHSEIANGFLILLGVHKEDTKEDIEWLAKKVIGLRIFEDTDGKMNRSIADHGGQILVVSQFTLIASNKKGNRPSFNDAATPEKGMADYQDFCKRLTELSGIPVAQGRFGADMKVRLVNDGPVTILFDTRHRE